MRADRTRTRAIASAQGLDFTPDTARRHAPLVQRASAIIAALGITAPDAGASLRLRDAAEDLPGLPQYACVTLHDLAADAPGAGLRRDGAGRVTLNYRDSDSEAALGALIACIAAATTLPGARPATPIAADAESLSVLALAERLAASEIPVLINGPTGTGKEVLSRFIHDRSPRADGPFIAVNCAAMPETMLEALLFGHQKGAFTGATQATDGFFRAADGGTLLLDEIAEMPLALQAKLLRALQESEVVPIGATQPIKVDVRVIAAANRDLPTEVAEGRFRADLYYRLNVFPLGLRPLHTRPDDIAPLAFAMLLRHAPPQSPSGTQLVPWISEPAIALLRQHSWPGNVRELENVMRRALLLCGCTGTSFGGGGDITPDHIRFDSPARLVSAPLAQPEWEAGATEPVMRRKLANIVQRSEAQAIIETLHGCGGSRIAAARQLGISERTLRYRLAAFRDAGIDVGLRSAGDYALQPGGARAGGAR
jgi:two-component system response regulator FlrC